MDNCYGFRHCSRSALAACALLGSLFVDSYAAETWNTDDIKSFIDGATIMAAGGGGSPTVAAQLSSKYFSDSASVILNDISDIESGKGYSAASVGAIGSPASLFNLPDPLGLPLNAYVGMYVHFNHLETPISYLMPIEVGAINGLYPFLVAAELNKDNPNNQVSVLNVDGGGRSVPTLPLLIYSYFPNVYDQSAVVSSPLSTVQRIPLAPSEWAILNSLGGSQARIEETILALLSNKSSPYNGAAGYGSFYTNADDIQGSPPVTGQIRVARDVGRAYQDSSTGSTVAEELNDAGRVAKVVFSGTVMDVTQDTQGLDYGVVTIAGSGSYDNDEFTIQYENENICAYLKSHSTSTPYILGPDSVAYVPTASGVFDNSDLYTAFQKGEKPAVDIVAIQASSQITDIPGIVEAWASVRAAIPNSKCDFPYSTPWLNGTKSR